LFPERPIYFADFSTQVSIQAMAADVLHNTSGPLILAGLSLGGYVAFEIWRQAPERVVGMVLANTSARNEVPEQTQSREALMERVASGWTMETLCRAILPFLVHRKSNENPQLLIDITTMANALGSPVFFRQQRSIMARKDSRPDLPQIQCPVLVVTGDHDTITPPVCQTEMMAGLPNAERLNLPCGHMSSLEMPDLLNFRFRTFLETHFP
jgi:pimeloyl-ACP methyl ester carboxylesterase